MNRDRASRALSVAIARIGIRAVAVSAAVACSSPEASHVYAVVRVVDGAAPPAPDAADGSLAPNQDAAGSGPTPDATTVTGVTAVAPDAAPDSGVPPDESPTGPQVCGFSACPPDSPCADLTVDRDDLLASILVDTRTFAPTDCAMVEGCILTPGTRRLLHFDTGTQNVGTADVVVGDPTANACFQWSACHQHYHFKGVGKYTLYQPDGTTVAAVGHKQGFCLEDVEPIPSLDPPPAPPDTPFTCTNQGLHVGFEDIYPNDIDCQWVDITGVPAGSYILSVIINSQDYLPESNYENNEARVPVTILPP